LRIVYLLALFRLRPRHSVVSVRCEQHSRDSAATRPPNGVCRPPPRSTSIYSSVGYCAFSPSLVRTCTALRGGYERRSLFQRLTGAADVVVVPLDLSVREAAFSMSPVLRASAGRCRPLQLRRALARIGSSVRPSLRGCWLPAFAAS